MYFWERNTSQYVEMPVICHNEINAASNGAVHELVIVRVVCDEVPIEVFDYESNVGQEFETTEYVLRNLRAEIAAKYFIVFQQNVAGYQ